MHLRDIENHDFESSELWKLKSFRSPNDASRTYYKWVPALERDGIADEEKKTRRPPPYVRRPKRPKLKWTSFGSQEDEDENENESTEDTIEIDFGYEKSSTPTRTPERNLGNYVSKGSDFEGIVLKSPAYVPKNETFSKYKGFSPRYVPKKKEIVPTAAGAVSKEENPYKCPVLPRYLREFSEARGADFYEKAEKPRMTFEESKRLMETEERENGVDLLRFECKKAMGYEPSVRALPAIGTVIPEEMRRRSFYRQAMMLGLLDVVYPESPVASVVAVEKNRTKGGTGGRDASLYSKRKRSATEGRRLVRGLRSNAGYGPFDVDPGKLPEKPSRSFFDCHVDLYYASNKAWVFPGDKRPFWIEHPEFESKDVSNPKFSEFLIYLSLLIEKRRIALEKMRPKSSANTSASRSRQRKENVKTGSATTTTTTGKENQLYPPPPPSFSIKYAISAKEEGEGEGEGEGKEEPSTPTPAVQKNELENGVIILRPRMDLSSCSFFDDCYKITLNYDAIASKETHGNPSFDEEGFPIVLLGKEEKGREVWGIKVPKSAFALSFRRKEDAQEIPVVELGEGITVRNAVITSISSSETTIAEGDVFSNCDDSDKISVLEKGWKEKLHLPGCGENALKFSDVTLKRDTVIVNGTQENDKWIILKKNLSVAIKTAKEPIVAENDRSTFSLSFVLPYVPSHMVRAEDHFKNRSWFFHYRFTLGSDFMTENVCFNPNLALCRKTMALNHGCLSVKRGPGLSSFQFPSFVARSSIPGDYFHPSSVYESEKLELERNAPSKYGRATVKAMTKRNEEEEPESSPAPAFFEMTPGGSGGAYQMSSASRGVDFSGNPFHRVETRKGSFLNKNVLTTCYVQNRKTDSSVVRYVVVSDSDLPGEYAGASFNPVAKHLRTTLSLTPSEEEGKRPLAGDTCRFTVYTESELEFAVINSLNLQEGEPLLVDLDVTDDRLVIKKFNTTKTSARDKNETLSILNCEMNLRTTTKNLVSANVGGVVIFYDGNRAPYGSPNDPNVPWVRVDEFVSSNLEETDKPSIAFFNQKRREMSDSENSRVMYVDLSSPSSKDAANFAVKFVRKS